MWAEEAPQDSGVAVGVYGLGKMYRIYNQPQDRLKQMLWLGQRRYGRDFWALRGVSFELKAGQALGVIGRNGSGKSTLLQLVAGTVPPTEGSVQVRGRVAALLELGSGFNPEFTGRENVFLNGAIVGLSRDAMEQQFDDIAAFAGIGEFIDQPVKTYSSGMAVRLAFAVQVHVQADVLIVDEALAVGDIFFQQKCFEHIGRLRDAGVTILYVSHDLASVKNVCDRVLVMKDGGIAFDGAPSEGVNLYFRGLGEALGGRSSANGSARATRSEGHVASEREISERSLLRRRASPVPPPALELRGARVCDEQGHDGLGVEMMAPLLFQLFLRAHRPVEVPIVGLHLHDRLGNLVFASGTLQLGEALPPLVADQELVVSFRIEMRVSPGEYTFDILTGEPAAGDNPNLAVVHDSHESLGPIVVSRPPAMLLPFYGIAQLPITVSHQHRSAPPS